MRSSTSRRRQRRNRFPDRIDVRRTLLALSVALAFSVTPVEAADLTVGWISRTPELDYVWDSKQPETEGWPAEGEIVTWRAHVRNWSDQPLPGVRYVWRLDGETVAEGSLDLAAGTNATLDLPLPWSFRRQKLSCTIDPANEVSEESEVNNELTVFTDAIAVGYYVEQTVYDFFRANQHKLGIGSTCFENWAQRTIALYNDMAPLAIYPETPDGVLDRWRLQKIVVVPDRALPLVPLPNFGEMGGEPNESTHPNKDDRGIDLQWGFPATWAQYNTDLTTVAPDNRFYVSSVLIHELGHARYLTDVYGWNIYPPGDSVSIFEGTTGVAGSSYMPYLDNGSRLHLTGELGLMNAQVTFIDRYSAILLNRIAGHRAVRGNYNEPENIAEYLNDLPARNVVTIRDTTGAPVPNATVQVFQAAGESRHWYAKKFDRTPDLELTTDADGRVDLGRCPFSGDGKLVHTWRRSNVLAIVRVKPPDRIAMYGFLESLQFNLAYWRGDTELAHHELVVGPQRCVLKEPELVTPAYASKTSSAVNFEWLPVAGATAYEIWIAPRGEKPRLLETTAVTSSTGRLTGDVFWWVVAKADGCPPARSITGQFTTLPRLRPTRR